MNEKSKNIKIIDKKNAAPTGTAYLAISLLFINPLQIQRWP